jgi:signal transduction histidine kinase
MSDYAVGAAFIDGSGALQASDPGFRAVLRLPAEGTTAALRALAERTPSLRALLAGDGPDRARLDGGVELERQRAPAGALVLVRAPAVQERLEEGLRGTALQRLVAGMAHDIKNPLNALSLQLALLGEKLSPQGAGVGNLASMREQIGRVNEVVRRFVEVTDPSAPLGSLDLGALLADAGALLGHEARRRRVELVIAPPRGGTRTAADPARAGGLVVALVTGAMASTPDGGRLEAAAAVEGVEATLRLVHAVGDGIGETGYDEVAAAAAEALGGSLLVQREEGVSRVELRLPRSERA